MHQIVSAVFAGREWLQNIVDGELEALVVDSGELGVRDVKPVEQLGFFATHPVPVPTSAIGTAAQGNGRIDHGVPENGLEELVLRIKPGGSVCAPADRKDLLNPWPSRPKMYVSRRELIFRPVQNSGLGDCRRQNRWGSSTRAMLVCSPI
ncbi:hypothetical protein PHISP_00511 [Aspergillus sp. HF37]|nr:hypothetical protein PHISP_00511 [Aspergillus sp. HF37]